MCDRFEGRRRVRSGEVFEVPVRSKRCFCVHEGDDLAHWGFATYDGLSTRVWNTENRSVIRFVDLRCYPGLIDSSKRLPLNPCVWLDVRPSDSGGKLIRNTSQRQ